MVTNLRTIRKERGMTQGQLSEATGIHKITISKYESGKVDPTLTSAERIATALGVTINDLIGGGQDDKLSDDPTGR